MTKLWTPKFRVAFPDVYKAKAFEEGKPKFGVTMLFDLAEIRKDPEELKLWEALKASVPATAISKWGSEPAKYKKPFKKGDEQTNNETGEVYNGFAGMVVLNAASTTRPAVVDENVVPILEGTDFYGGCYAKATVNMYAWSHKTGGKGISCGLQNIQKVSDGEAFSGKATAEEDFGAIATATAEATNDSDLFDE